MKIVLKWLCAILGYSGMASADYYQAAINQAAWKFSGSQAVCTLSQDIPLYGNAEFVSKPGQPLRFSIQELRYKPPVIRASLSAMPAPWQHKPIDDRTYPVYLDKGAIGKSAERLSVYAQDAEAMLDVLLQGQYPTFSYIRASSTPAIKENRVAISAIKFAAPYQEFANCRNNLATVSVIDNAGAGTLRKKRRG